MTTCFWPNELAFFWQLYSRCQVHVLEWPPCWIKIAWYVAWAFKHEHDSLNVLSNHSTWIPLSNCSSMVTSVSLAWNIVSMTPRTAHVAGVVGVILFSVPTWEGPLCKVLYCVACKVCFPSRVPSLISMLSALKWINRPGARCGGITALLARSIFVNAILIKFR